MAKHIIEYQGESITIPKLAELANINYKTLYRRIVKLGWNVEKALSTPVQTKYRKNKNKPEETEIQRDGGWCTAQTYRECFRCKYKDCIRESSRPLNREPSSNVRTKRYNARRAEKKSMRLAEIDRKARMAGMTYGQYQYEIYKERTRGGCANE